MNENNEPEFQIDSFEYTLSSQIGYARDGQKLYTDKIALVSPLVKLLVKSMELSQMINLATMKAIPIFAVIRKYSDQKETKLLEEKEKEEDKKKKESGKLETPSEMGDRVRLPILTSDINFEKLIKAFKNLAFAGSVTVEGTKINHIQWSEISEPDLVEMFFQFAGVFIMPSLFPAPKELEA